MQDVSKKASAAQFINYVSKIRNLKVADKARKKIKKTRRNILKSAKIIF